MKSTMFSPAAKVGLTSLIGMAVLAFFVVWIGKFTPGSSGIHLTVNFKDVGGLIPGARVQLMGVKVGDVLELTPKSNHVAVAVYINRPGIEIPANATFMINSKGIVGDKVMEIYPPLAPEGTLKEGDVLAGTTAASISDLTDSAGKIFKKVQLAVEGSDNQAMAKRTRDNLDLAAKQMPIVLAKVDRIAAQLETLTTSANRLVAHNSNDVSAIIAQARLVAAQAEAITSSLAPLVTGPRGRAQMAVTVDNVHQLTAKVNAIANDVASISGDKTIQQDIREIVGNAKEAAQNAKVLTKGLLLKPVKSDEDGFKINVRTELLGSLRQEQFFTLNSRLHGNFNMFGSLGFGPIPYFRVGLDDIGESNLVNMQMGMKTKDGMVARFGLVRNKLGIGTDLPFWDGNTLLSGELYDIVTPHMRLGLLQGLNFPGMPSLLSDTGVSLYWDNQFRTGIQEFNLGVRWQPHN